MENQKIIKYLKNTDNPYMLKIGDMVVNIEYANTKKKFNECISNILKQKQKGLTN